MIRRFRLLKRSDKTRNRRFQAAHKNWRKLARIKQQEREK